MSIDFVVVAPFSELSFKSYIVSYKPFSSVLPERSYNLPYKKRPLAVLAIGLGRSVIMSENQLNDDLKAFCERLLLTHNNSVNDS
jgi:hypothetical protein